MNLLTNAIKYTRAGGRVDIHLTAAPDSGRITVTDTGVGIEPDLLPHVFEPFRQADWHSAGTQGGLGLGLAIVREIVELHGGTVAVQSKGRNAGATFIVTLPTIAA
jgi:signal transduction histidine kinase